MLATSLPIAPTNGDCLLGTSRHRTRCVPRLSPAAGSYVASGPVPCLSRVLTAPASPARPKSRPLVFFCGSCPLRGRHPVCFRGAGGGVGGKTRPGIRREDDAVGRGPPGLHSARHPAECPPEAETYATLQAPHNASYPTNLTAALSVGVGPVSALWCPRPLASGRFVLLRPRLRAGTRRGIHAAANRPVAGSRGECAASRRGSHPTARSRREESSR